MGAKGRRNLEALDLLRMLCALAVLFYHYGSAFGRLPDPHAVLWTRSPLPDSWMRLSWWGWIGVELFFVISGCVIAGSAQGASATGFLVKRAARLFPAAWICASLSLAVLVLSGASGTLLREWLGSMALSPAGPWIDDSYWTLGVEILFYLLVAAYLALRGGDWIEPLGLALAGASFTYWLLIGTGLLPEIWLQLRIVDVLLLTHGAFFALGIWIRAVLDRGVAPGRLLVIAFCLPPCLAEIFVHTGNSGRELGHVPGPFVPMAIFLAGIAVMLAANRLQPLLTRWLRPGWAMVAGLATYPLYLLHQAAGAAIIAALVRAGLPGVIAAPLVGMAMLALALLIAMTAEPWLRARLIRAASGLAGSFRPAPIILREHAER